MNKKLLFAAMSLAALTACTNDDFESKQIAAEESSPIQFEVINDASTRASMDGNAIVWNANQGDLFTLYHGAVLGAVTGYENATYKANAGENGAAATLTTPTVIKQGGAIMVWPVDSTFRIGSGDDLTLKIPAVLENVEHNIPYVSDLIDIEAYAEYSETAAPGVIPTAYKTAGLARKYQVYMRPMASQLNLKADYAGTDATLATLETGDDPIEPIKVTSVDLLTTAGGGTTDFTTEIPLKFTAPTPAITAQWAGVPYNKWNKVTDFDIAGIVAAGQTDQLTTKCLTGNESCKFLILPQAKMTTGGVGVADAGIVVNTIYGKVVVADGVHGSLYTAAEINDAWYRFLLTKPATDADGETTKAAMETDGDGAGKYKCYSKPEFGMKQTINAFTDSKASSGVVNGEPIGAATTRYVKVLLTHLDMTDLHIKSDKQLRDAARVWKKMGLNSVTVYLDGSSTKTFLMSQKTIETINAINAAAGGKMFTVKPCNVGGEQCNTIIISHKVGETSSDIDKIQDLTFIVKNGAKKADVRLQANEKWMWDGTVKIATAATTGINEIINWGTLENNESKTLKITEPNGTTGVDITFVNDTPGKWDITAGTTIRVQNDVRNNGKITIALGAQYRQDGALLGAGNAVFTNDALGLPTRFGGDNRMGKVYNDGVFATISDGVINNYGLIEHGPTPGNMDAKTYITHNETAGANFGAAFAAGNMKGRINLPYSNKDEDNISISATTVPPYEGFISVTVDGDAPTSTLDAGTVGKFVNYMIVKSGIDNIAALPAQVEYLEVDAGNHEIYWSIPNQTLAGGLIVLSDVNIKLGTTLNATTATYLGKEMYVGGTFNTGSWNGYYGNTAGRVAEHYVTY
jgi:hypothetical protein